MASVEKALKKLSSNLPILISLLALLLLLCAMKLKLDGGICEGFSPAAYPAGLSEPLLHGCYATTEYAGLSPFNSSQISANYPIYPADHVGTNNIRYWARPTNGTCTPADICTNLYKPTKQNMWKRPRPPPPDARHRVNYYVSHRGETIQGT